MVKRMEKKTARLLAFILALIMIGSVLVYAFRNPSKPEEREIKFDMGESWRDWIKYIPGETEYILFYDYGEKNKSLKFFIYNSTIRNVNLYVFRDLKPEFYYFKKLMICNMNTYLVDVGKTKVYFVYTRKDNYLGFDIKLGNVAGRIIALSAQTNPIVIGYPSYVAGVIRVIRGDEAGFYAKYKNYTDRIGDEFSYVTIVAGKLARTMFQSNNTSIADFYFEGYRINDSLFEKVVAIHFTGNYFFAKSREIENKTVYYYYENYEDGLSIATMASYDLEDLINTTPEIRTIIIKFGNETS